MFGVPVDDDGGKEVQPCHSIMLALGSAVADELRQFAAAKIKEIAQEISHTHEQTLSRGHEDDGHSL
ncbi:hypothetical protein RKLH11_4217 [Rhodobacteraceae bacterium KLH11]|nr:hypothetical protein RKLH11_4217 [Rhodobacteraceae bacterium KLH11]